ncbi:hypothetical protein KORDIASMS9_01811 [Kordia sp. SMS9]|uniref:hypothetical protein n=1 Tax=Kordia sp. SMS9 TaxID=2282170 RepID=UPI000E0D4807|nr:hypothetical protein [Kordia sp. SMS9]AXG69586.1 hypothetical protein KORDIASMS9_01811 [Kordia sp. SMS9]
MNRSKKRKRLSFRDAYGLLWEDIKVVFNAWKETKKQKKLYKAMFNNGLISEKTFNGFYQNSDTNQEESYKQELDFYNDLASHFGLYIHELTGKNISSSFGGFTFLRAGNFMRENFQFEGSISFSEEHKKYFIHLSVGTLIHFEYLSMLYGSVACVVPDIKSLQAYYNEINRIFHVNFKEDDRTYIKKLARPSNAEIMSAAMCSWQKELNVIQGLLGLDILKGLKIFMIGHEFGHLVNRLSTHEISYFKRAEDFFKERNIPRNQDWLEELSCDAIALDFSIKYITEKNYLKNTIGVHKPNSSKKFTFLNPICFLTSRYESLDFVQMTEAMFSESKKGDEFDVPSLMISVCKIIFWNLSDLTNDYSCDTHPSPSLRLDFIISEFKRYSIPNFVLNFSNAFDILKNCLDTGNEIEALHHPHFEKLSELT